MEQWLNISRFHREIKQEFINLAREYYQESFLARSLLSRGEIWKGDILTADLEALEKLDASDIFPRRINAKEVLIRQKDDEFIFPVADGTAKLSGGDYEFREPTARREQTVRSDDLSGELQREQGESQPTESTDESEARADFRSIEGDFTYPHHIEPRVQLYVPKEETFPIPLKYIDVTRSTHTDLDVMQEKRVDENWILDSNRSLSDSWKGFTNFILLKDKPHKGKNVVRGYWQKLKRLPDQIMYGRKYGPRLVKPLRIETNKNGKTRSQNSTMLLMTKITKKLSKLRGEIGNFHGTSHIVQENGSC